MYRKRSVFAQPDHLGYVYEEGKFPSCGATKLRNWMYGVTVCVLRNLCNASTVVNRNKSIFGCGDAAACHVSVEFLFILLCKFQCYFQITSPILQESK